MVSDEVAARAGNQRDELLYQLVRREYDMRSPVSPNLFEAQSKPTIGQFLQTVVRDGWSGKIATKMFRTMSRSMHLRPGVANMSL